MLNPAVISDFLKIQNKQAATEMQEPRCHEGVSLSAENIAAAFWSKTKHGEATLVFMLHTTGKNKD